MPFFKTAKTDILAYKNNLEHSFTKSASYKKTASYFQNSGTSVDIKASLELVADEYHISKNPDDYIFVISRALTADVPNENNDCFPKDELLRFDIKHGCRVFQTFKNKPNHINHRADDPKQARGVIIDAHFNGLNSDDEFVEILVAVDRTKDKRLAEGILNNQINSMSMGCYAEECRCSVCGHSASSVEELCPKHIRGGNKGKIFDGKKSFEFCHKVSFQEESWVDDPADPMALVSEVMDIQAKLDETQVKHRLEDESQLLILSSRLAKVEQLLETKMGELSKIDKEADLRSSLKNMVQTAVDWFQSGLPRGEKEAVEAITQFIQKHRPEFAEEDIDVTKEKGILAIINQIRSTAVKDKQKAVDVESLTDSVFSILQSEKFGNKETLSINKESKMAKINPYKKLVALKSAKGGGNPSDWKNLDSGKGNPPKEWANPGKQKASPAPSEWKSAFLSKVAVDDKAKEYWTKYYKDGYGAELIKDIKRKKISSNEVLSLEQMKVLEPKLASLMESQKIGCIKVDTILKMSELFKEADKPSLIDTEKGIDKGKGDTSGQKWEKLTAGLEKGALTLDLLDTGWHVRNGSESLMVIENVDNLPVNEFESDEFGQNIVDYIVTNGPEKTSEKYKVALYPAIGNEPSLVNEVDQKDDIRDKSLRPEPKDGVEENSIQDMARPEADDDGVDEKGHVDTGLKSGEKKKAREIGTGEMEDIMAGPESSEEKAKIIQERMKESSSEDGPESINAESDEASIDAEVVDKAAGALEMADADIDMKLRSEPSKGITTDMEDDLESIDKEKNVGDKVYDSGQDDFEPKRTKVVTVGKKIDIKAVRKDYAARFRRALDVAIKRANLNMINNELKASMFDMLVNESELPDGDLYTGMDEECAAHLVEQSFQIGASKFFGNMLKEAERYACMTEDSFLEIEADVNELNVIAPKVEKSSYEEEYSDESSLHEVATSGNPVFKSSSTDSLKLTKYSHLEGLFGTAIKTPSMGKLKPKKSFLD